MYIIRQLPRYVQGAGVLRRLGPLAAPLGRRFYVIAGETAKRRHGAALEDALEGETVFSAQPCRACTRAAVEHFSGEAAAHACDCIIGLGGGKAADSAKLTADALGLPLILLPTVASSDAPCSSLAIVYDESGAVCDVRTLSRHPDLVAVDSTIIASAPPRMLSCGMGDALSTYFEARTCFEQGARNTFGGEIPAVALAVARACLDTLYAHGPGALAACRAGEVTPALDRVIEANTYMSTLGFECGGVSCAHALQDALATLPDCRGFYHGELVAFGTLCLLTAEGRDQDEIARARGFCRRVDLPITLRQLGLTHRVRETLLDVKHILCPANDGAHCIPAGLTPDTFVESILAADAAGEEELARGT